MFCRSTKSMLSTPLHSSPLFSPSINWTQLDTQPHLDRVNNLYIISPATALTSAVPSLSAKSTKRRRKRKRDRASSSGQFTRKSIIERTFHHTSNCVLHQTYYKLTPHSLSKGSLHSTSMSTCHRISKARLQSRYHSWVQIMAPVSMHMHPTNIWTLITNYKHHRSQVDNKAPSELVHLDVCGLFIHLYLHRWLLLYHIHWRLHMLQLCLGPPWSEVQNMHLSLQYTFERRSKTQDIY